MNLEAYQFDFATHHNVKIINGLGIAEGGDF